MLPKPRQTTLEKEHRRAKWLALGKDVRTAQDHYAYMAKKIAINHGHHTEGDKLKLTEFVKNHHKELYEEYGKLIKEELQVFRDEVDDLRLEKKTALHANAKGIQKDIDNMFNLFKQEFHALEQHTGCSGFYIAICGDVEHYNEPKIYMGSETESFFKDVLNMNLANSQCSTKHMW
ncbi:hypothetical protein JB92DRAFT_2717615 [Gautieria morchelliformis]|nr:hypothetical protein JB92DRAFT_2717615 [Gautieria morchelliformis]